MAASLHPHFRPQRNSGTMSFGAEITQCGTWMDGMWLCDKATKGTNPPPQHNWAPTAGSSVKEAHDVAVLG